MIEDKLTEEQIQQILAPIDFSKMYVHYNDDGSIISISNTNDPTLKFIEVKDTQVADFMNGTKNVFRYKVDYFKSADNIFVKKESDLRVDVISLIPVVKTPYSDLTITYSASNKTWTFSLNESSRNTVQQTNLDMTYTFYVTRYRNPHFLISTIEVTGKELLKGITKPFTTDEEANINEISLVTTRHFNSYGIVVNE